MMSDQQITERLEKLGYKDGEIRAAFRDVSKVIILEATAKCLSSLPEEQRAHVTSLPEEEVQAYVAEHRNSLPPMPQEQFEKIYDETWEDYFRSVV